MVLNLSVMPSSKISSYTSNSIARQDRIAASTYAVGTSSRSKTTPEPEGPTMRTGGVYGFLAPSPEQPRRPGEWQTYDITLVGRVVTVVQNGQTIIDKQEIPGITGGALDSHEALPGPIYLQGSEAGHVAFRNITITPAR